MGQRRGLLHQPFRLRAVGIADEAVPETVGDADFEAVAAFTDVGRDVDLPRRAPRGAGLMPVDEDLRHAAYSLERQTIGGRAVLLAERKGGRVDGRARIITLAGIDALPRCGSSPPGRP